MTPQFIMDQHMFIDICSDIHLDNYPDYLNLKNTNNSDVLVIAGDLSQFNLMKYHKGFLNEICGDWDDVVFVPGNHEYYRGDILSKIDRSIYPKNFHLLDNELIKIKDIVFYGGCLWNNFNDLSFDLYDLFSTRISDFTIVENMRLDVATKIHLEYIDNLYTALYENPDNKFVVVSHFPPSQKSIHEKYKGNPLNRYFVNDLDEVVDNEQIKYWIHGHTHDRHDYMINNTRVVCNPRGYPSEKNKFELVTVEI